MRKWDGPRSETYWSAAAAVRRREQRSRLSLAVCAGVYRANLYPGAIVTRSDVKAIAAGLKTLAGSAT